MSKHWDRVIAELSKQDWTFRYIADQARLIGIEYPEIVRRLADSIETLRTVRDDPRLAEHIPTSLHGYRSLHDCCDDWYAQLRALEDLVALHLPALALSVTAFEMKSHQDHDFDWQRFQRVMNDVYSCAVQAASGLRPINAEGRSIEVVRAEQSSSKEEWSPPMSKSEMARRLTADLYARARKIEPLLKQWGLRKLSRGVYQVRLDRMDAAARRRVCTVS